MRDLRAEERYLGFISMITVKEWFCRRSTWDASNRKSNVEYALL